MVSRTSAIALGPGFLKYTQIHFNPIYAEDWEMSLLFKVVLRRKPEVRGGGMFKKNYKFNYRTHTPPKNGPNFNQRNSPLPYP